MRLELCAFREDEDFVGLCIPTHEARYASRMGHPVRGWADEIFAVLRILPAGSDERTERLK